MDLVDLRVVERIGQGSAAEVWKAEDSRGRVYCVKFMLSTAPAAIVDLVMHANPLIRVAHPGVVGIRGIHLIAHPTRGETMALVMEFVSGTPLSKYPQGIAPQHANRIASALGQGLQAIHDEGLVHGDLHGGNVIITDDAAKLIDLFYTHSLAVEGAAQREASVELDLRALASVLQEVGRLVEGGAELEMAAWPAVGETATAVASEFLRTLAAQVPEAGQRLQEPRYSRVKWEIPDANSYYLILTRLDNWGLVNQTHVVANSKILATHPVPLIATSDDLVELRHGTRDILSAPSNRSVEPWALKPADLVPVPMQSPRLVGARSGTSLEIVQEVPEDIIIDRYVGVLGLMGPFLFIEYSDEHLGGVHPYQLRSGHVINLETMETLPSILLEEELQACVAAEGAVAKVIFEKLRQGTNENPSVDLVATVPYFPTEGVICSRVKHVFSTGTGYPYSDHRWSAYSVSEEIRLLCRIRADSSSFRAASDMVLAA